MKLHVLAVTEEALIKADAEWVARLVEAFGEDQVDAMAASPKGAGRPNSDLHIAYKARQAALLEWRAARGLDGDDRP